MKNYSLVIGASENPDRYSNRAILRLREQGFPVHAIGLRKGRVGDVEITTGQPAYDNVDTVTLYVGPQHQDGLGPYLGSLRPRRVIFNPGTESRKLKEQLLQEGIAVEEACTLVLLGTGQY